MTLLALGGCRIRKWKNGTGPVTNNTTTMTDDNERVLTERERALVARCIEAADGLTVEEALEYLIEAGL
jgi:hypothetical protein